MSSRNPDKDQIEIEENSGAQNSLPTPETDADVLLEPISEIIDTIDESPASLAQALAVETLEAEQGGYGAAAGAATGAVLAAQNLTNANAETESGLAGGDEEEGEGRISWRVTAPAALIAVLLVLPAMIWPESMTEIVSAISAGVVNDLGWYYTLIVVGFVVFALFLALSRYGDIVLGPDDEDPEYNRLSWIAMLFAAGMGIGLVFWGVSEPLSHYTSPPPGTDATTEAELAQGAMNTTFLHWGLSAWAIYVVVGVSVAYMCHRRGRSVSIRWVLEPLFGERVKGWLGDLIDITAVIGTLFGVATSLGFGATQFASGLDFLGLIEQSAPLLLLIVVVISALAALSVASGLDKGIKLLSNGNLILAGLLMVAVALVGQPLFVAREFVQSLGQYIEQFIALSFRTMPYQGSDGEAWLGGWTTYYWGWWMSWSPFVGIFIARISRGRTVREFVVGVLAVPTLMTFLWFTAMGGTALWYQIYGGVDLTASEDWTTTALFALMENLPGGPILSGLFLILLVIFFVTSSDSASFVLGMLSSDGSNTPPLSVRLGWAAAQGSIAALLLWVGASNGTATDGLSALQVLAVLTALPFSVVMVLACFSMTKAFAREHDRRVRAERQMLRERLATFVEATVEDSRPPLWSPSRWTPREAMYTTPRRRPRTAKAVAAARAIQAENASEGESV